MRKAEGILLYDDECKQYLGYFPGDPDQDTQTKLLQCQRTTLRHHRPGPYGSRTSRRLFWHLHRLRRFEAGISRCFYKTQKMPRSGLPKRGRLLCVATCLPDAGVMDDSKSSGDGSCHCRDEASDLRVAEAHEAQADHIHSHMIPVVEQALPRAWGSRPPTGAPATGGQLASQVARIEGTARIKPGLLQAVNHQAGAAAAKTVGQLGVPMVRLTVAHVGHVASVTHTCDKHLGMSVMRLLRRVEGGQNLPEHVHVRTPQGGGLISCG